MTAELRIRPEVAGDTLAAFAWYEAKAEGLGSEFLRVLYAAIEGIARQPLLYRPARPPFRRCLLRRFPYAVYFTLTRHRVLIFGVFHCARNPTATGRELRGRRRKAP
ncbi:MAG: type II toxin-antitoxin system RelE/ParE family toxin [Planctomycetes bacterium]|nr:type II toxin-antitoxin system RelE/ParE family toxin [Planctomycetota bacterium]